MLRLLSIDSNSRLILFNYSCMSRAGSNLSSSINLAVLSRCSIYLQASAWLFSVVVRGPKAFDCNPSPTLSRLLLEKRHTHPLLLVAAQDSGRKRLIQRDSLISRTSIIWDSHEQSSEYYGVHPSVPQCCSSMCIQCLVICFARMVG